MPSHIPLAPGIHFYENLLTSEEGEHITTLATTLLSDSMVSGKTEGYVSNGRISQLLAGAQHLTNHTNHLRQNQQPGGNAIRKRRKNASRAL